MLASSLPGFIFQPPVVTRPATDRTDSLHLTRLTFPALGIVGTGVDVNGTVVTAVSSALLRFGRGVQRVEVDRA